jgi:hypothetical protein
VVQEQQVVWVKTGFAKDKHLRRGLSSFHCCLVADQVVAVILPEPQETAVMGHGAAAVVVAGQRLAQEHLAMAATVAMASYS